MEKELKDYDEKVKSYLNNCLSNPINDIEKTIIESCLRLTKLYSFSKTQTYPRPNHPLKSKQTNLYFTVIAILISLRTTLENETKATQAFIEKFKNIDEVIKSNINDIAEVIKCAGMPLKKAETILKASKYIKDNWNNDWNIFKNMNVNNTRNLLIKIPGFGEKAVDCLLVAGLEKTSIPVDVNVLRVVSRIFNFNWAENPDLGNKEQLKYVKDFLEKYLRKENFLYQIVHTLFLIHGKNTCNSKLNCSTCCLVDLCKYSKSNTNLPLFTF